MRHIIVVGVTLVALTYAFQVVRLSGLGSLNGLANASFVLVSVFTLFAGPLRRCRVQIDIISFLLIFVIVFGLVMGVFSSSDATQTIWQASQVFGALLLYQFGRGATSLDWSKIFNHVSNIIAFAGVVGIISGLAAKYGLGIEIYHSFGGVMMLFPLIWWYLNGKLMKSAVIIILQAVGAKLGVVLAIVSYFTFQFIRKLGSKRRYLLVSRNTISTWLSVTAILFLFNAFISVLFLGIVSKFTYYIEPLLSTSAGLIDISAGGRNYEVLSVLQDLKSGGALDWVFGKGFGYSFEIFRPVSYLENLQLNHIHFTPVSLLGSLGVAGLVLWLLLLVKSAAHLGSKRLIERFAAGFVFSVLIFSLTAFSFFNSFLFWICVGIMSRSERTFSVDKKPVRRHTSDVV